MSTPEIEDLISAAKVAIEEMYHIHGRWENSDLPDWVPELEAAVEAVESAQ